MKFVVTRTTKEVLIEKVIPYIKYYIIRIPKIIHTPSSPFPINEYIALKVEAITSTKPILVLKTKLGH